MKVVADEVEAGDVFEQRFNPQRARGMAEVVLGYGALLPHDCYRMRFA
jgi:hypothetical protein